MPPFKSQPDKMEKIKTLLSSLVQDAEDERNSM